MTEHLSAHLVIFGHEKARLQALAYRLLGSVSDAEDLLQDTYLRWQQVELSELRQPEHYLTRMVTHGALDVLRSAQRRRESYTGVWLPEPWLGGPAEGQAGDPARALELADSLTTAFLLMLERLTPLERAVFVLRVVFDYEYAEIAELVGESAAYCRQLLHRAREHLQQQRQRAPVTPERQQTLLQAFVEACQRGELMPLQTLLAEDAILYSDGGGKARAALNPIYGADKIARFLLGVMGKTPPGMSWSPAIVNGALGMLAAWEGQPRMTVGFDWGEQGIEAIYIVINPDKLQHLQA